MKEKQRQAWNQFSSKLAMVISVLFAATMIAQAAVAARQANNQAAKSAPAATMQRSGDAEDPSSTLAEILATACRHDTAKFPDYLTLSNATFYKQLTPAQQVAILRRLVLLDNAGRALLSTRADGTSEIRCETSSTTRQIHIATPRTDQNISFVPIDVNPDRRINFGMVATKDGWKLISLGLIMLDFAQLQPEWDAQDMAARENGAVQAMQKICAAIDTYRNAFEKLPDSLAQLGPAPKEGISPDAAGLLKEDLVGGTVEGYTLRYRILPAGAGGVERQFELMATPAEYGKTGKRSFFMNDTLKLRGADKSGAPATAADPLIDESGSNQ